MGTRRGRPLKTREWVASDSPVETGDHTVVMAEEYVAVCFSLIAICNMGMIVGKWSVKGGPQLASSWWLW